MLRSLIVDPPASGTAQWEGETLVFYPSEPLLPDTLYTVTIPAGLRGQGGQTVQRPVDWQFRTGHPRVLYLAEDGQGYYQIVLVDPLDPGGRPGAAHPGAVGAMGLRARARRRDHRLCGDPRGRRQRPVGHRS